MSRKFLMKTAAESVLSATAQLANSIVTYAKLNLADGDIPAAKLDLSQTFNFTGTLQKSGVDIATQAYVDGVVQGLDLKDACRAGAFVVRGSGAGEWTGSGNTLTAVDPGPFVGTAGVDDQETDFPVPIQLNDRIFIFICTDPDSPISTKIQDPYAGTYTLTTPGAFPAYSGGTEYQLDHDVMDGGYSYRSLINGNFNNTPVSSPAAWAPFLAHDNTGGPAYSGGTTYAENELVVSSGVAYRSRVDDNIGNTPGASPDEWAVLPFVPAGTANTSAVITRTTDANSSADVSTGMYAFIVSGQSLGGTGWVLRTPGSITLNTTPLNFTQFNSGTGIDAGEGLELDGSQLNVRTNTTGTALNIDGSNYLAVQVDDSTVAISGGNQLQVKDGGITAEKLAAAVAAQLPAFSTDLISTNSGTTTSPVAINPAANRTIALELVHIASLDADRTITMTRFVRALLYKGNAGATPVLVGTSEEVIYDDADASKRFCDGNSGATDADSAIDSTFLSFTLGADSITPTVNGVQSGTGYSVHHTVTLVSIQQV